MPLYLLIVVCRCETFCNKYDEKQKGLLVLYAQCMIAARLLPIGEKTHRYGSTLLIPYYQATETLSFRL